MALRCAHALICHMPTDPGHRSKPVASLSTRAQCSRPMGLHSMSMLPGPSAKLGGVCMTRRCDGSWGRASFVDKTGFGLQCHPCTRMALQAEPCFINIATQQFCQDKPAAWSEPCCILYRCRVVRRQVAAPERISGCVLDVPLGPLCLMFSAGG